MVIAALIPTLHRPAGLWRVLQSLEDTAPDVVRVVATDKDDRTAREIALTFNCTIAVCRDNRGGCAHAWNTALMAYPDADIYVLGADDAIFTAGWLEAALRALDDIGGDGLIGFNGQWKDSVMSFHYLMTRKFMIEHHGGVAAVPHYFTWGVDTEACKRAMRAGKYKKAMDAIVLHDWQGPDGDETYRMGAERRRETKKIYGGRAKHGFPDDFERIIG
jgi:GT2 family glycosyltransferase